MTAAVRRVSAAEWSQREDEHRAAVDARVFAHEQRRAQGIAHPVEDFLFTYYPFRPNQLRRWHAGVGVVLDDAAGSERAGWPFYRTTGDSVTADAAEFALARGPLLRFVTRLMRATSQAPGRFGCFGLHEWAMVYRQRPSEVRHSAWPLRVPPDEIADAVESRPLQCTHFDAFRFFTDAARPLNSTELDRDGQLVAEQPGCLHAGMDLYKWAYKLTPLASSDLVLRCFDLAREIRYVDMRASPYDLSSLGLAPIRIETADGRAEYVARQRELTDMAAPLRRALLEVCEEGSAYALATSRVGGRD